MPRRPKPRTQVEAVDALVAHLRTEDQLTGADEPLVAMAQGLARAVETDPGNAALWRELRTAVAALRQLGEEVPDGDDESFLVRISTPVRAKVGDPQES